MTNASLEPIVDLERYPLDDDRLRTESRRTLQERGALVLPNFIRPTALASICAEARQQADLAFFTREDHNIYLAAPDTSYPAEHPRNKPVRSSKGCITDDQIPPGSALRSLYEADQFRAFLCAVLEEAQLYEYADPLSSINLHYAGEGQELGWHFDNSSFAITLLVQQPLAGGRFEYVRDLRIADAGDMNYERSAEVLAGAEAPEVLDIEPGDLVLFRGKNSLHRVTPTQGQRVRMLAVLAYNTQPDVALSESARMTFFGRLS